MAATEDAETADDGFANQQFVEDAIQEKAQQDTAREFETVELYGVARELFVSRILDTFSIERHGVELEFYRPVDTDRVDRDSLEDELDEDLFARIVRGSDLLDTFERVQERVIRAAGSGDADLEELLDESMSGVALMREILACHAVDESLADPQVWAAMFRNEERLSEVFEDFTNEGSAASTRQKLDGLQSLMSGEQ